MMILQQYWRGWVMSEAQATCPENFQTSVGGSWECLGLDDSHTFQAWF